MKLRTKLLLGYAGFVLALGVLGAWSARTLSQMSAVSGRIIAENYDSVVAAQDMKESLERQDSAAVFDLLGEHDRAARQAAEHRARFDAAFDKAAANITEVGEPETIDAIRSGRDDYYRRFDAFLARLRRSHGRCTSGRSSRSSTPSAPTAIGSCTSIRRRCAARPTPRRASRAAGSSSRWRWRWR